VARERGEKYKKHSESSSTHISKGKQNFRSTRRGRKKPQTKTKAKVGNLAKKHTFSQ
jgi:hypothetical protein